MTLRVVFRCDPALIDRIPRPQAARRALPERLRAMPATAFSETHGLDLRTVKQCPPFVDAMAYGFVMPLVCDVEVEDGRFRWDFDLPPLSVDAHPRSPLSFHVPAQVEGAPFHQPDRAFVKFNSFWTIELPAGWSLFAGHPVNRWDLPFRTLSGLVDGDRFNDVGVLFRRPGPTPAFAERGAAMTPPPGRCLSKPDVCRRRFRARRGHAESD